MTAEDVRAAAYRSQQVARAAAKRATERALAGDAASLSALEDKTEPLLEYDTNGVPRAYVKEFG